MIYQLKWQSPEYHSTEDCRVEITPDIIKISSQIRGRSDGKDFAADYTIITGGSWKTIKTEIVTLINNKETSLVLEAGAGTNWLLNGQPAPQLCGCIDIDIPLTPFTNSLPINRLRLREGETHQIKVLYIDLLEDEISAKFQQYRKISYDQYSYQNVPNDFEAMITVDENGFVINYPGLFSRIQE